MDRANAAQLAARAIKQAKPRTRRGGGSPAPVRPAGDSVTAVAPQSSGGGLFGGSIQSSGSFDFAAPGGLSFPPSASFGTQSQGFGIPSPEVSDNEGRFEGDDRMLKRPFGTPNTVPPSNSFPPGPFGQSQASNPFASTNQPQTSGGGIYSFGSQPQVSSGINFNTSTPANNSFTFGATSSQPTPPVEKEAPYNFGSQQNQPQATGSIFNFGQQPTPQDKPASAPFQFGQTSSQTVSSGINFNSTPATAAPSPSINFGSAPTTAPVSIGFNFTPTTSAAPSSNLFGRSMTTETTQTSSIFAPASQTPSAGIFSNLNPPPSTTQAPAHSLFSNLSTSTSTSQAPSSSIFSGFNSPATSAADLFGKPKESPAPTNNIFGGLSQAPATSNIFAPTGQTSNIFGEKRAETASNNISSQSGQAPAISNLSGEKKTESAPSNPFANLNKSTPSNLFSNRAQESAPLNNLFGASNKESSPMKDPFGTLNKPVDPLMAQPEINGISKAPKENTLPNSFSNIAPPKPFVQPKPLFSSPAPFPAEASGSNKPDLLPSTTQPSSIQSPPKNNTFSPFRPVDAPAAASQPPPSGMFPSLPQPTPITRETSDSSGLPPNRFMPAVVHESDPIAKLIATRSITEQELEQKAPGNFSVDDMQKFCASLRISRLNKTMQDIWGSMGMRDPTAIFNYYNEERLIIISHYNIVMQGLKRRSSDDSEDQNPSKRSKHGDQPILAEPSNKRKASDDEENRRPNKGDRQLESSSSLSNGAIQNSAAPVPANPFSINGNSNKTSILAPPSAPPSAPTSSKKRRAEEELTQDTEHISPLRREIKTPRLNGSTSSPSRSQTSALFENILESPSNSAPAKFSPQKKVASPEKPQVEAPRFNPFGSLPVPKSPTKNLAPPPAAPNMFAPPASPASANTFAVKATSAANMSDTSVSKGPTFKMPTFSGNSNFLAQFGAQAKKSEEDEEAKLLQKAKDEDLDSDDDEAEFEAEWRKKRAALKKELEDISKRGSKFKLSEAAPIEPSLTAKKSTFEPPVGARPLFGHGASSQGSGNSVFSSLNGSRTSTPGPFGSSSGSVLDGHTPGKPASFGGNNIFGHLSDQDSGKGEDEDEDSADGDGGEEDSERQDSNYKPQAETGSGPPSEKTGAGIASTKKSNPFGLHSTFGTSSGTSSPGGSIFDRGSKEASKNDDEPAPEKDNGGTRTPGGSLFDRITKDSSGNPVRHISTDEKENTQPSSRNIFGDMKNPFSSSFNKPSSAPTDQTWKPDSPIKFGASSNDASSAPTIDVTAATPTKSSSPANLFGASISTGSTSLQSSNIFGNTQPGDKPFANLFGTSGNPKPAASNVGFNFGGAPSAPGSLLPSGAASATTSRATTPGATTDGDSGADADPDVEHHEQIDLTAGGPGEEDEESVHEVRAKALKWCKKEEGIDPWVVQGVGPLRVLKHKETGVSRILLRADPSGKIIMNKGILGNVEYKANGKTLKITTASDDGKGMETYVLQLKTPEFAKKLAEVLEANKAS